MSVFIVRAIEDNRSQWPERFPLEVLLRRREEMGSIFFASQYLNQPVDFSSSFLRREWLQAIYPLPRIESRFVGVDPSVSGKRTSDFFALAVVGIDQEKRFYVLDLFYQQIPPGEQVNIIFRYCRKHQPSAMAIETNAAQVFLPILISSEAQRTGNLTLPHIQQVVSSQSKGTRFTRMATAFENQRVRLAGTVTGDPISSLEPFIEEWCGYPLHPHDDALDAVYHALSVAGLSFTVSPVEQSLDLSPGPRRLNQTGTLRPPRRLPVTRRGRDLLR
jgi:predicted phage terminase large subunit-like protein